MKPQLMKVCNADCNCGDCPHRVPHFYPPHAHYAHGACGKVYCAYVSKEGRCVPIMGTQHYREIQKLAPEVLDRIPRYGDLFVDVGAGSGTFTLSLSRTFTDGIAIEPDPRNLAVLEKFVPLSVRILPVAVRKRPRRRITLNQFDNPLETSAFRTGYHLIGDFNVVARPLDELLLYDSPDFIKIDVNGMELNVLKSGKRVIRRAEVILTRCYDLESIEPMIRWFKLRGKQSELLESGKAEPLWILSRSR